jgi:transcription elongation factor S-II
MEVEQAAYETFKGDNADYRSKLRSLFQNLKTVSNRELGQRVMSGEILAAQFVVMSQDELKSAERRKADEKLHKENLKKAQVPTEDKSVSDALKCGRCGQKKVSYTQAQTRSADEPMTTFCECTVCGNRWKVRIVFLFLYLIFLTEYIVLVMVLSWLCLTQNTSFLGTHYGRLKGFRY